MALDHVAELARQAVADHVVLHALQSEPTQIRKPLHLSEAHLRALISAGSFTTARPAFTTSTPAQSLAHQIAAMDVGTLFPPEGQGHQFPTPGELPPVVMSPQGTPAAAPSVGTAPRPTAPSAAGQPPHPSAPAFTPTAPVLTGSPQPRRTPTATPISGQPQSPQAPMRAPARPPGSSGGPQQGTWGPSGSGQTPSSCVAGLTDQGAQSSGSTEMSGQATQDSPTPCLQQTFGGTSCCPCVFAMVSIVAELSTTTQTAISAITAIAGMG